MKLTKKTKAEFDIMDWVGYCAWIGVFLVAVFSAFILVLTFGSGSSNTDPRAGTVYLDQKGNSKKCDGATLVYYSGGGLFSSGTMSPIPNSPECVAR